MKPLKSGLQLANWLLRISLTVLILVTCLQGVKSFDFSSKEFYLASIFSISAILLVLGGMSSKNTLTILSGFIISALSIYKIISLFSGALNPSIAIYLMVMSIGFYFVCTGNQ